jgi:hypothetical protein
MYDEVPFLNEEEGGNRGDGAYFHGKLDKETSAHLRSDGRDDRASDGRVSCGIEFRPTMSIIRGKIDSSEN